MVEDLGQNKTDAFVVSAKSVLGAVPFAGPLLSELIGTLIPNQRLDRLTKYVKELEERLSNIDSQKIDKALNSQEGIDLLEEGFVQASRSFSDSRRKYVANVVANGIDDETIEYSEATYLLNLMQEINEQEIIWLRFFMVPSIDGDEVFRARHKNVIDPVQAHLASDQRTIERASLQESYIEHLERLGLIKSYCRVDVETGFPEFDKFSGKPAVSHRALTPVGRMLLRHISYSEAE